MINFLPYICSIILVLLPCRAYGFIRTTDENNQRSKLYIRIDSGIPTTANKFKDLDDNAYLNNKLKKRAAYNIGVGYHLHDNFRLDLNFTYRTSKYKAERKSENENLKQKIKIYNFFLNGYFDFNTNTIIIPYITAGLGYSHDKSGALIDSGISPPLIYPKHTKNNFIWNIGFGNQISLTKKINLDISYKYLYLGKIKLNHALGYPNYLGGSQNINSKELSIGIILYI